MPNERGSVLQIPWVTLKDFMESTNISGLTNAHHAKTGFRKFLWLVIFTCFFILTIVNLFYMLQNLFTVYTDITVRGQSAITFPAVTICNQNRVSCENLKIYFALNNCSLSMMGGEVKWAPDSFACKNAANIAIRGCSSLLPSSATSNVEESKRKKRGAARGGAPPSGPTGAGGLGAPPELVDAENLFLYYYMSMDARDRMMIGHQFDDTIKACSFRGKDCTSSEHFLKISSASYGNCFTFNSKFADSDYGGYRKSSLPGASLGLNLVVKLDQKEYMDKGITQSAGARVTVHTTDTRALADEFGLDVLPATSTSIGLEEVSYERIEAPYESGCIRDWSETNYTEFLEDGNMSISWPYTQEQCKRFCMLDSIMSECSCFPPLFLDNDNGSSYLLRGLTYMTTTRAPKTSIESLPREIIALVIALSLFMSSFLRI